MEIIIGKQGTQKMPITEPTVSRKHCKVTINGDGTYTIENLSTTSFTKVDGQDIIKTKSTLDCEIQLGPVFKAKLKDLIGIPAGKPTDKEFSISHLQKVWEDYHEGGLAIKDIQHKMSLYQRIPVFFTIGAGALTSVSWSLGWGGWVKILSICLTVTGFLLMIYFFKQASKFNPGRESDKLQQAFQNNYHCPNPECQRFLGNYSYTLMKNQNKMSCPYCKCKYTEND